MLFNAFLSMFHVFVSSRRELSENCVSKQGGLNCFIDLQCICTENASLPIFPLMILKVLKKSARVCNYINTTGAASGAGAVYPYGPHELLDFKK
jgi:hypothetical protein